MMKVLVYFNPISGGGRGAKIAELLRKKLEASGMSVAVERSSPRYDLAALEATLRAYDRVVIIGGDGTLRPLLPGLAATGVPLTMIPAGNESLFCRRFGMSADPATLVRTISEGAVEEHRYGLANDQPFFTMVSVGLDSAVVARIDEGRAGPIGYKGYLLPTLIEFFRFRSPSIRLCAGSDELFHGPAYIIVANSPEYARGLNPVAEADSASDALAVRVFPNLERWGYLRLLLRLALGMGIPNGRGIGFFGAEFSIESDPCYPVQADGDALARTPVHCTIAPRTIRVIRLAPA